MYEIDLKLNLRDFIDRIKDCFDVKNDSDIARMMGIRENTLNTQIVKNSFNSKTFKKILSFIIDSGLSINWILYGVIEENISSNLIVGYGEELLENIKKLSQKRQEYYYYRIKADLIEEELGK